MSEELLAVVDELREKIKNKEFNDFEESDILETLKAYNNHDWKIDETLVKYLMMGWNVYSAKEEYEKNKSTPLGISPKNEMIYKDSKFYPKSL